MTTPQTQVSRRLSDQTISESRHSNPVQTIAARCNDCGACVARCGFLQSQGSPREIALKFAAGETTHAKVPFQCNLCSLCTATCPRDLDPAAMFLEMRRTAFKNGMADFPEHRGLRRYEALGTSRRFTWYALPADCDTVFFPGCALTGSRPEVTQKTFESLQRTIPNIGITLDCCTKPSHDLGDQDYFMAAFSEMKAYLLDHGIRNVLVACPNCAKVFSTYAKELKTRTVYEALNEIELQASAQDSSQEPFCLHDPCVARFDSTTQNAVRQLLAKRGINLIETLHQGSKTVCCGEGGAVRALFPEHSSNWIEKRLSETEGRQIVSYCASCTRVFTKHAPSSHVLDLLFSSRQHRSQARGLQTYRNRLRVKKQLQNKLPAAHTRERQIRPETLKNFTVPLRATVLVLLCLVFALLRNG